MYLSAFELQSHCHFVSQKVAAAQASEFDQFYFRQVRAYILTSVAKLCSERYGCYEATLATLDGGGG